MDIDAVSSRCTKYDIIQYPYLQWDRYELSCNRNITVEMIDLYMPNAIGSWDWCNISYRISMKDVIANPDIPWDRKGLSGNYNIPIHTMYKILNPSTLSIPRRLYDVEILFQS